MTTRRARAWSERAFEARIARAGSPPAGARRAGPVLAGGAAILAAGRTPPLRYTLDDMAKDAVGRLDALASAAARAADDGPRD